MRATLFLSSLFAVSLIGSAALAERPSEGSEGRRPIRDHKIQELRPHEASTVRERATPVHHEKVSTREARAVKEAPTRGDNVDRSYASHAAKANTQVHQNAQPASKTINQAYLAQRNCSDTSVDCAKIHGQRTGNSSDAAAKKDAEKPKMTRAQVQEMVEKLHKMMCERNATSCVDYL